jgi:hypothetical protein
MPGQLTLGTFLPHLGAIFRVIVNERLEMIVKLTEATRWGASAQGAGEREPFTLVFHTLPDTHIPQATYRVESDALEPMDLFLVPIGPDARGMRYQAVFS